MTRRVLFALVLSSCAPARPVPETPSAGAVECRDEPPTGSHLPVRRCRDPREDERRREGARRALGCP